MARVSHSGAQSKNSRTVKALSSARVHLQECMHEFSVVAGAWSHWPPMGFAQYEDIMAHQELRARKERMYELTRRKWIETRRIGDRLMIRLTARGWQQALRDQIRSTRARCKEGMCIVIFDVPESERRVRDALRDILGSCGFTMCQKSVWVNRKDVLKPLCALLQGANLEQWVRVLVGRELTSAMFSRMCTRAKAAPISHAGKDTRRNSIAEKLRS